MGIIVIVDTIYWASGILHDELSGYYMMNQVDTIWYTKWILYDEPSEYYNE